MATRTWHGERKCFYHNTGRLPARGKPSNRALNCWRSALRREPGIRLERAGGRRVSAVGQRAKELLRLAANVRVLPLAAVSSSAFRRRAAADPATAAHARSASRRQSRHRCQVRDDRELRRRRARVAGGRPAPSAAVVHRQGARRPQMCSWPCSSRDSLQLRRAAVPDEQVVDLEAGHRFREGDPRKAPAAAAGRWAARW